MDDLDRGLIVALRQNGRASLSELAAALSISRATARARIDRMQESGEITGFTITTRSDEAPQPIRGLMLIGIEGRGTDRIIRALLGHPEVIDLHTTNGRWDLVVTLATETMEKLDRVLAEIRRIEGVATSETNLLLARKTRR